MRDDEIYWKGSEAMTLFKTAHSKLFGIALTTALVASLCLPTAAWATIEGDQTPATEEEIAAAIADGTIKTEDPEAGISTLSEGEASTSAKVSSSVTVSEYAGATMFETAAAEAKAAYPGGSHTAVIAGPGDAWVDALASAGLAASKGPILFTEKESLHPATAQALKDLGAKSVVIVGGPAAVGEGAEKALRDAGFSVEARLAGADCYGTQMAIYDYGLKNNLWNKDLVIVATGTMFGDALSVSPIAYAKKAPIFLANASKRLNDEQYQKLIEGAKAGYGINTVIVGGTAVIDDYTSGQIDYVSSVAGGSGACTRLAGDDQYKTSAEIAKWAVGSQGFSWNNAAFTTGLMPYDALAGSVLQGKSNAVLLLVTETYPENTTAVAAGKDGVDAVRFFGGKSAVPSSVRMSVADKLGFPYAALPGFKVYVDAGHGQNDLGNGAYASGAVSGGYKEAELTKELAGKVGAILKDEYGVDVYVNDDGGPYKLRHAEAKALGCDAIVSIHFNSAGGTGSESLIHNYNASFMSSAWQSQIHPFLIKGVGLADRGKKTQEVAILGGILPATLLEVCFIDNANDMKQYQARKAEIAHKIAEGIVQ